MEDKIKVYGSDIVRKFDDMNIEVNEKLLQLNNKLMKEKKQENNFDKDLYIQKNELNGFLKNLANQKQVDELKESIEFRVREINEYNDMHYVKFQDYNPFKYNTQNTIEELMKLKDSLDNSQSSIEDIYYKTNNFEKNFVDIKSFKELRSYIETTLNAFKNKISILQNNQNLFKANLENTGLDKKDNDSSSLKGMIDINFLDNDSLSEVNRRISDIIKKLDNKTDAKEMKYVTNEIMNMTEKIENLTRNKLDKIDVENVLNKSTDLYGKIKNLNDKPNEVSSNINYTQNRNRKEKSNNNNEYNVKFKEIYDSMNNLNRELGE